MHLRVGAGADDEGHHDGKRKGQKTEELFSEPAAKSAAKSDKNAECRDGVDAV